MMKELTKIKDLPPEKRPREKLIAKGPAGLALAELLAIVLGAGTRREEVMTMASRLLSEYGERAIVNQTDPQVIALSLNLPLVKSCQLAACFELGRRLFRSKSEGLPALRSAKEAYIYLADMRRLSKEQLRALYLNNRYQLIHDEIISLGNSAATIIEPREIFKPAIQYGAAAVILAHNHPSGIAAAGRADRALTKKLVAAGETLNIKVVDHLIIAGNKYFSLL
jgi:DNA repair protein RadC